MYFTEGYRSISRNKIQLAHWSVTHVTTHLTATEFIESLAIKTLCCYRMSLVTISYLSKH